MIRVAQVVGKMNGGGVEQVLMNYYRHINRSLVQFDFIIDEDSIRVPCLEIEELGGRVFVVPPYQRLKSNLTALVDLFRVERWSIVHSHLNALSVFPLWAAKRASVPVRIAHSHSTANKKELGKTAIKGVLKQFSNRYPTHRVACSVYVGKWLFGSQANYLVLPNAIDVDAFRFDADIRREMRAALDLPDDALMIGHMGRFMRQKNHGFLVEAQAAGLPCLVSDRITREVAICDKVEFLPIDDPELWANRISAAPSRFEPLAEGLSGYDIKHTAQRLAEWYLQLEKEEQS